MASNRLQSVLLVDPFLVKGDVNPGADSLCSLKCCLLCKISGDFVLAGAGNQRCLVSKAWGVGVGGFSLGLE